jgi:hypothetical protein
MERRQYLALWSSQQRIGAEDHVWQLTHRWALEREPVCGQLRPRSAAVVDDGSACLSPVAGVVRESGVDDREAATGVTTDGQELPVLDGQGLVPGLGPSTVKISPFM